LGARGIVAAGFLWFVPPDVRSYVTENHVVFDPELGWRPGVVAPNDFAGNPSRIPYPARPGQLRGFVFGDSQAQGAGVARTASWPVVTADLLRATGLDVEIINAASPGYRSAQVLLLMETRVMGWEPDFFIVDCRNGDSPRLPHEFHPTRDRVAGLLFESRLYRLLRLGVASVRGEDVGVPHPEPLQQPLGDEQRGPGNHEAIAELAASRGVELYFLDYPYHETVHADTIARGFDPATAPPGTTFIGSADALVASGRPPAELFFDRNHLTVEGNRLVAQAAADALLPGLRARSD
jgi:hypothetical protein